MKYYVYIPLILLTSCSWINMKLGFPDDNIAEEIIEGVIEKKTGLDIDLTPYTLEYESKTLSPMPPFINPNVVH